jgi:hypothetical protein
MVARTRPRREPPPEPGELRRTELILEVENRPGVLAEVGEVLGAAEVNIVTAAVYTLGRAGRIHLIVDEADRAVSVLKRAGIEVEAIRDVMSVTLEDRPGELGRFARSLAEAGININGLYIAGERGGEKELIVSIEEPSPRRRRGG